MLVPPRVPEGVGIITVARFIRRQARRRLLQGDYAQRFPPAGPEESPTCAYESSDYPLLLPAVEGRGINIIGSLRIRVAGEYRAHKKGTGVRRLLACSNRPGGLRTICRWRSVQIPGEPHYLLRATSRMPSSISRPGTITFHRSIVSSQ